MSAILEKATAHFRDKVSADMKYIHVPEWDSKIWFKNTVSLREQSRLIELSTQGKTVEAVVESLIVKARNEDGSKMFNIGDKSALMNEIDPNVLIRVVSEINEATNPDLSLERVEKN